MSITPAALPIMARSYIVNIFCRRYSRIFTVGLVFYIRVSEIGRGTEVACSKGYSDMWRLSFIVILVDDCSLIVVIIESLSNVSRIIIYRKFEIIFYLATSSH